MTNPDRTPRIPPPDLPVKQGWLGKVYWSVLIWALMMACCLVCAACRSPEKQP